MMKISYDTVRSEYIYPLSKADVRRIKNCVPTEIWRAIEHIRFGFSAKSGHAGRVVKRGKAYSIRVNFCLR